MTDLANVIIVLARTAAIRGNGAPDDYEEASATPIVVFASGLDRDDEERVLSVARERFFVDLRDLANFEEIERKTTFELLAEPIVYGRSK
jgi:hypothetical protein